MRRAIQGYHSTPGLSCSVCGHPREPSELVRDFGGALVGRRCCYVGRPKYERRLAKIGESPVPDKVFGGETRPSLR